MSDPHQALVASAIVITGFAVAACIVAFIFASRIDRRADDCTSTSSIKGKSRG